ncbi:hydantoinase B/oxoprolinase family protein [Achromobacter xylosoxidans]|uniref:Hydantoinase B/oxoprolinase family protein n=1 Tax=Alcaligenes xylosoxydans xylosoxydans TaxID=85698 RepID=A0A424WB19_ALCXX|nr:hydantoinase B/oxoprolinase family protein [Achromobacter xylosoxidans]MBC9904895.1 hydantoinase B/oxoprolinase family protein [Achromobacter xylosoxidans]MBD0868811.1 hydantoinase B/oxoprolinase family protein [Achromobacter xylosoxidans]QNP87693.1 hydantoinase B/oxoprolinase family protein [Achromobacter xylosoxidans]RPJ90414.1 hydantoinase B/oxoprolinase family protein [Achromobacter xylosoxidans]
MTNRSTSAAGTDTFDPIEMEVFSNRLLSITEEMGNTLIRSSFSTNIKERKDCSVALFDAAGRLVAQAAHVPVHLGSLSGGIDAVLRRYGAAGVRPGDAFLCNDAYLAGGTHAPDITVITPIFHEGVLRFFAANIGHHTDVGGAVPGSTSHHLKTVWEEGIRLPAMRIVREGELDMDLLEMIAHNTREPDNRMHDIRAQIATNDKGARLMLELVQQSGLEILLSAIDSIMLYTERRLRNRIAQLPAGTYTFTERMDDDGMGGDPVTIQANVEARDGQLHVDFTGTSKQARGAFNLPASALNASVYFAVKAMLDPELMPNNGLFQPITITAPEGTITNPRFPAAVGARVTTAQRVAGTVIGALGQLLPPDRAMASCNDVMPSMLFSVPMQDGKGTFVYLETLGGGAGGRAQGDGMDGIQVHVTNTSNLPAEALEIEYPLLVEEYALVNDSGGAGRHRGGMGIARQIRSLHDQLVCTIRCDAALFGAAGLNGGLTGGTSRVIQNPGRADEQRLPNKIAGHGLASGQSVRLETPGGGGYGAPADRSAAAIRNDVLGGKVSRTAAERDYGAERVALALQGDAA